MIQAGIARRKEDRLGVVADGRLVIAQPQVDFGPIEPPVGKVSPELDYMVQILQGLVQLVVDGIADATVMSSFSQWLGFS